MQQKTHQTVQFELTEQTRNVVSEWIRKAKLPKKLQEHDGIVISASPVRAITEYHAGQIYQAEEWITDQAKTDGCKILIGEIDGSMIPIVKVDEEAEDKR